MTYHIVPEDGIVAISEGNSDDDLIPLQRALPPSTEEVMDWQPSPLPNSMLLSILFTYRSYVLIINVVHTVFYAVKVFLIKYTDMRYAFLKPKKLYQPTVFLKTN